MTARILAAPYEGARAEYLATFILSSFSSVVQVPRQEDFGVDQICFLTELQEGILYAKNSYSVQIKKESVRNVKIGGWDKNNEKWKRWEIEWFYKQDAPYFLAVTSEQEWRIKIYSVNAIWRILWMTGRPFELILIPELTKDEVKYATSFGYETQKIEYEGEEKTIWKVALGKPILDIEIDKLHNEENRKLYKQILKNWIDFEYANIRNHKIEVPYSYEIIKWETNKETIEVAAIPYANNEPEKNIAEIVKAVNPIIVSLMFHLKYQSQPKEKLDKLKGIFELIEEYKQKVPSEDYLMFEKFKSLWAKTEK